MKRNSKKYKYVFFIYDIEYHLGGIMNNEAGLFLIGLGVGMYIPMLPKPVDVIQPFLGLIIILIGVLFMIKK